MEAARQVEEQRADQAEEAKMSHFYVLQGLDCYKHLRWKLDVERGISDRLNLKLRRQFYFRQKTVQKIEKSMERKQSKLTRTTTMTKTITTTTTTTTTTTSTTTSVNSTTPTKSSDQPFYYNDSIPDYGIKGLSTSKSTTSTRAIISPCGGKYIITAGTDRKIRYWDMESPHNSYIISGLDANEAQPKYRCTSLEDITVFEEEPTVKSINMADMELLPDPALVSPSIHHHDTITQLAVLEVPHQMLISGSRDGVVKVWH